jgi:hypothetical protein
MNTSSRIRKSRDSWKSKALGRASTGRDQRRQIRRGLRREAALTARLAALQREFDDFRTASLPAKQEPCVVAIQEAAAVRVTCVLLVVLGVIPFRAAPRCLQIIQPTAPWVPHFTSVINWTMRLGLALIQRVAPIDEPWIALVDMSIDLAIKKVMVVLRVPLAALAARGSALTLEDCEVVGLKVAETWKGQDVAEALTQIFEIAGAPVAILKDGGLDLKRGVEIYRVAKPDLKIHVIEDVGHVAANALKAEFAGLKPFKNFLKAITKGAAKLRQSALAYLTPPKLRTKGRFMGITRLAEWAEKILPLLGGRGRVPEDTLAAELRRMLGGLGHHRLFLDRFIASCQVTRNFLEIAKNKGVNQESYRAMKAELTKLPAESPVRGRLERFLGRQLRIQSRLGIGQMPLPVSSDILESLFGKFKVVMARNTKAEFNQNILTIPCLCGKLTSDKVAAALNRVNQRDLESWVQKHVAETQWQRRAAFNRGELRPETVPKAGKRA